MDNFTPKQQSTCLINTQNNKITSVAVKKEVALYYCNHQQNVFHHSVWSGPEISYVTVRKTCLSVSEPTLICSNMLIHAILHLLSPRKYVCAILDCLCVQNKSLTTVSVKVYNVEMLLQLTEFRLSHGKVVGVTGTSIHVFLRVTCYITRIFLPYTSDINLKQKGCRFSPQLRVNLSLNQSI